MAKVPAANPVQRRSRKRLATRQRISDAATVLFMERGFDQVTVDEIAEAADVSRMTVFNHFARKEDMFFDLDNEGREAVLTALEKRGTKTSPVEALRLFAHRAVAEGQPYVRFFDEGSQEFMETIKGSEALKARARAIRDEMTEMLAGALAKAVRRRAPDAMAHLAASMLVGAWTVAYLEGHRVFRESGSAKKANKVFLGMIDRGSLGVEAAGVC